MPQIITVNTGEVDITGKAIKVALTITDDTYALYKLQSDILTQIMLLNNYVRRNKLT